MVTFNAVEVIEHALASILRHRSSAVELVVIDGGSTDGTVDILRRYDAQIDYWKSEPDDGIYDAMNKVLEVANGDWLLFLGADDELLASPDTLLPRLVDAETLYHGNVQIAGSDNFWGGRFSRYRLMQENICHQAILYPRSVYRTRRYDTGCGILADHRYNIEVKGSGVRFVHLDLPVSLYNDRGRSSTGDKAFEAVKLVVIRDSFGCPWYLLKRFRNALVRQLKQIHGAA